MILVLVFVSASCHVLQALNNGKIHNNDTKHGALVYFACNKGFQLKGLRQITCIEGKWNGSTPTCEGLKILCFFLRELDVYSPSSRLKRLLF